MGRLWHKLPKSASEAKSSATGRMVYTAPVPVDIVERKRRPSVASCRKLRCSSSPTGNSTPHNRRDRGRSRRFAANLLPLLHLKGDVVFAFLISGQFVSLRASLRDLPTRILCSGRAEFLPAS